MSYNITHIKVLTCDARIKAGDVKAIIATNEHLPDTCLLNELARSEMGAHGLKKMRDRIARTDDAAKLVELRKELDAKLNPLGGPPDEYIPIPADKFKWRGEGSGATWHEVFLPEVAPKIMGTIDAVVIWEGGDTISGLRIVDGKVTEPDVIMSLADDE